MTTVTVPVNLSDFEWGVLVEAFLADRLLPESLEVFRNKLADEGTIAEAVYDAIRNDAANHALLTVMAEHDEQLALDGGLDLEFDPAPVPTKKQRIWVTFRKEGIHRYPAAATDPKLKTGDWDDVSFLGVEHRHIFHFRVTMEVFHDDRDVEFIQFKRWLERLYSEGTLELNHKSCEMISDDLHAKISARFPGRYIAIEVAEDGENGSFTEYPA